MLYHREGSVNLDDLIKIELFEILNPKFKKKSIIKINPIPHMRITI